MIFVILKSCSVSYRSGEYSTCSSRLGFSIYVHGKKSSQRLRLSTLTRGRKNRSILSHIIRLFQFQTRLSKVVLTEIAFLSSLVLLIISASWNLHRSRAKDAKEKTVRSVSQIQILFRVWPSGASKRDHLQWNPPYLCLKLNHSKNIKNSWLWLWSCIFYSIVLREKYVWSQLTNSLWNTCKQGVHMQVKLQIIMPIYSQLINKVRLYINECVISHLRSDKWTTGFQGIKINSVIFWWLMKSICPFIHVCPIHDYVCCGVCIYWFHLFTA